jgi:hypothetical protein
MNGKTLCAVAVAIALAAGSVAAQKAAPKLYRWVDKEGKVHYDQALPPEAVNEARKEFSTKSGQVQAEVERALTPEERAAQEAAAAQAQAAQASEADRRHQEEVMLATYSNENDLRRAYGERIDLLKTTLESTDVSIRNVRENLAMMLAQASETELSGRKVTDDRLAAIRELHAESTKQQSFQANRRVELEALNAEFARMLQRYRELKNAEAAAPATPGTTPATPPLPGAAAAPGG